MQTYTFKMRTLLVLVMLLCGLSSRAADDLITQQITIDVAEAGTLPAKIGTAKRSQITNLKLTGELNSADVVVLRTMTNSNKDGHLETLDLEGVKIVEGGGFYYFGYATQNDVMADFFFEGSNCLKNLKLPAGLKAIGNFAFSYCTNLQKLSIPEGVVSIGYEAFENCTNLVSLNIPEGVTKIERYTFAKCSQLAELTIPTSVTTIEESAFRSCESLKSVILPEGLSEVNNETFYGCSSLANVQFPKELTRVGREAFYGCKALAEIDIPLSVTTIENEAFEDCSGLSKIYVHWGTPIETGSDIFKGCDSENGTVYVPKGTYQDYWLSEFGYFKNIVEYDATGIDDVSTSSSVKPLSRYSVNGQRLTTPAKGLNIVKYSDGSVRKEMVK